MSEHDAGQDDDWFAPFKAPGIVGRVGEEGSIRFQTKVERGPEPVSDEADWLALLRREVLVDKDVTEFRRFNQNNDQRFWNLLLLAFRSVEGSKERPRHRRVADLAKDWADVQDESRDRLRGTLPHLRKAIKELGKALTAMNRRRPGEALRLTKTARRALAKFTAYHEAAPLLRLPLRRERLEAAKAWLEHQATTIMHIKKLPRKSGKGLRRNHREHALRAIVHLAAAWEVTGRPLTAGTRSHNPDGFTALMSLFHRVAWDDARTGLIEHNEEGFILLARNNLPAIKRAMRRFPRPV